MEKILNKLISNKHLIYIIQEYSRDHYTFLEDLETETNILYYQLESHIYYENFRIERRSGQKIIMNYKINHHEEANIWLI